MALATRQNPDLLSMIGLGTDGGQPRADGSSMERGVHLRWGEHRLDLVYSLDLGAEAVLLRRRGSVLPEVVRVQFSLR